MLTIEKRVVLQMGPQLDMLIPQQLMVVLASTELFAMKGIVPQMARMVVLALTNQMAVKETWSKMGAQLKLFKARVPLKSVMVLLVLKCLLWIENRVAKVHFFNKNTVLYFQPKLNTLIFLPILS